MGVVSDHLRGLVERQVKERGLVVWFDPEKHYQEFLQGLSLPETAVERYEGSFFELRHRVEPHLGSDTDSPPRLVVYVPQTEEDTHHALVFGTAYPQDVALKFLGSERYDSDLTIRSAAGDLASLLSVAFGISLPKEASCEELRVALSRHVLGTEFVRTISGPLPPELSSVNVAEEELGVSRVSLENWLTGLMDTSIGRPPLANMTITFEEVDGHDICRVEVRPSQKPVNAKSKQTKDLYVRLSNGTRSFDIEDALDYISAHDWNQ